MEKSLKRSKTNLPVDKKLGRFNRPCGGILDEKWALCFIECEKKVLPGLLFIFLFQAVFLFCFNLTGQFWINISSEDYFSGLWKETKTKKKNNNTTANRCRVIPCQTWTESVGKW